MRLLLISPKPAYATRRLQAEVIKQDIELTLFDIKDLVARDFLIDPADFDAVFIRQAYPEFDRVINLAKQFTEAGKVVVDHSIAAGDIGLGKSTALNRLAEQGVIVPKPVTETSFPLVAQWVYGFGGKHTYLVQNKNDLTKVKQLYSSEEIMFQEFIVAEFEYKVLTVGYKALPVIIKLKTNHNKFLPDFKKYEVISPASVPAVVELAEKSAKILKRELAKADILAVGNQYYLLEVNRWPGLRYFETMTEYNIASEFLSYIRARL